MPAACAILRSDSPDAPSNACIGRSRTCWRRDRQASAARIVGGYRGSFTDPDDHLQGRLRRRAACLSAAELPKQFDSGTRRDMGHGTASQVRLSCPRGEPNESADIRHARLSRYRPPTRWHDLRSLLSPIPREAIPAVDPVARFGFTYRPTNPTEAWDASFIEPPHMGREFDKWESRRGCGPSVVRIGLSNSSLRFPLPPRYLHDSLPAGRGLAGRTRSRSVHATRERTLLSD